jgi:predicted short-subunit dehydrogenase-like oxidoreductase (DUF2520 family)
MRQVPHKLPPLLIGAGRLTKHFQHYFKLIDQPFQSWSRKDCYDNLRTLIDSSDRVGLLISDDAISGFYQEWSTQLENKTVFHCSGTVSHPKIHALHPLMTFGPSIYDLATYQSFLFVTEQGQASKATLLPEFSNDSVALSKNDRPLYHALCVASGNFTTLLWHEALKEFETLKIPPQYLQVYLQRIATNFFADPENALTGPLRRGDVSTVKSNLSSLQGSPLGGVYAAFLKWFPDLERQVHEHSRF